jgi:sterol desaturase/sphingolipid hydroxylase (fatty acid hydroxylase superfamily)
VTDHPPILVFAIPFFLLSLLGELLWLRGRAASRGLRGYESRDTWASLAMGVLSLVTGLVVIAVSIPIISFFWDHRITDLGQGWVAWVVALVAWDFAYYWSHRSQHRIRIGWANHVQHHSSERYNLSTALRQPVTNWQEWVFFPVIALLGVQPWIVFAAGSLNLIYQYWIHTEAIDRLPRWFEHVFNTPSHHRAHHGSQRQYLDRNYGGILIVWDRLFGTFEPEDERVVYGLTHNIHTFNPLRIATHEYAALGHDVRHATGLRAKVGHVLMPPGWAPGGAAPDDRADEVDAAAVVEAPTSA